LQNGTLVMYQQDILFEMRCIDISDQIWCGRFISGRNMQGTFKYAMHIRACVNVHKLGFSKGA